MKKLEFVFAVLKFVFTLLEKLQLKLKFNQIQQLTLNQIQKPSEIRIRTAEIDIRIARKLKLNQIQAMKSYEKLNKSVIAEICIRTAGNTNNEMTPMCL